MPKTDLEIAQECVLEPIEKVAAKAGIPSEALLKYGNYKAKISREFIKESEKNEDENLPSDSPELYENKTISQKLFIVSAGVIMNIVRKLLCWYFKQRGENSGRQEISEVGS
jgi:hypothetical protein